MSVMAECDNCRHRCDVDNLDAIHRYYERVDDDGVEPAGQCPECGALAYVD